MILCLLFIVVVDLTCDTVFIIYVVAKSSNYYFNYFIFGGHVQKYFSAMKCYGLK